MGVEVVVMVECGGDGGVVEVVCGTMCAILIMCMLCMLVMF